MIPAISLFVIVSLSALITRVAAIALAHTGLSTESARFQARSAYTGSGFTTQESEKIMNFPVRRKIIYTLMLIGNAGIVTTMSTLILAFVLPNTTSSLLYGLVIIVVGISFVWWAIRSSVVDRWLSKIISRALKKYTKIDVKDYASVLHLADDYRISELRVDEESWLGNKKLIDLELRKEGIIVLGIQPEEGDYVGSPNGSSFIKPHDIITMYGKAETFLNLNQRERNWKGEMEHQKAVRDLQDS
ncbi:TrkA C-terminal domain-containing protein [Mesonia ostreae]|uniref:TrkA C-terminal domain-containing protein n=1 Tax=Mesonia ostreae TaxID=861110 RepID=A0ABU2KF18_9FLAO|nr:TrkA C-terminal domain-containing protein [Mesonia ostreae]MDT0293297.1 TrkA C-terminal domain-containing protein [Mesonia ostreae]